VCLNSIRGPHGIIRLDWHGWRFIAECSLQLAAVLPAEHINGRSSKLYAQKSSGKVFYATLHCETEAEENSWKAALQYAHDWLWTKYLLLDPKSKPACESPQQPGNIPDQVYAALEPERVDMPPSKKYGRQSSRLVS
jgi:hypothetical protein